MLLVVMPFVTSSNALVPSSFLLLRAFLNRAVKGSSVTCRWNGFVFPLLLGDGGLAFVPSTTTLEPQAWAIQEGVVFLHFTKDLRVLNVSLSFLVIPPPCFQGLQMLLGPHS